MNYAFRTKDCPDPLGPDVKVGDHLHTMTLPLDDGGKLTLQMGEKGRQALLHMLGLQKADDERDFQIMCGRLLRRLPEGDTLRPVAVDLIRRKGTGSILRETTEVIRPRMLNTDQGLRDAAELILSLRPKFVPGRLGEPRAGQVPEDVWIAVVMIVGRWLHDGPDRA